jgi:hypothetical protein
MRGGYANRSGVQKALDRDVRRMLLAVAAAYFDDELLGVRYAWREIDLAVRHRPIDVERLRTALDFLDELLDGMHVFDMLLTFGQLAGKRA